MTPREKYLKIAKNVSKIINDPDAPEGTADYYLQTQRLTFEDLKTALEATDDELDFSDVTGQAGEFFKGIIPGAAGLVETAATGVASIFDDETEKSIRESVGGVTESIRESFAPTPGYEETVGRKFGEAFGSFLPFVATAPFGLVGRAAVYGLATGAGAGEARLRAEEAEATEDQRALATVLGAPVGALELLAPSRLLKRVGDDVIKSGTDFVKRAAKTGGEEAATEAAAGFAQNAIARGVYKPEQELIDGIGEEAAYGGAVGALAQGIFDLALGRKQFDRKPKEPKQERAERDPDDIGQPIPTAAQPDVEGLPEATELEKEEGKVEARADRSKIFAEKERLRAELDRATTEEEKEKIQKQIDYIDEVSKEPRREEARDYIRQAEIDLARFKRQKAELLENLRGANTRDDKISIQKQLDKLNKYEKNLKDKVKSKKATLPKEEQKKGVAPVKTTLDPIEPVDPETGEQKTITSLPQEGQIDLFDEKGNLDPTTAPELVKNLGKKKKEETIKVNKSILVTKEYLKQIGISKPKLFLDKNPNLENKSISNPAFYEALNDHATKTTSVSDSNNIAKYLPKIEKYRKKGGVDDGRGKITPDVEGTVTSDAAPVATGPGPEAVAAPVGEGVDTSGVDTRPLDVREGQGDPALKENPNKVLDRAAQRNKKEEVRKSVTLQDLGNKYMENRENLRRDLSAVIAKEEELRRNLDTATTDNQKKEIETQLSLVAIEKEKIQKQIDYVPTTFITQEYKRETGKKPTKVLQKEASAMEKARKNVGTIADINPSMEKYLDPKKGVRSIEAKYKTKQQSEEARKAEREYITKYIKSATEKEGFGDIGEARRKLKVVAGDLFALELLRVEQKLLPPKDKTGFKRRIDALKKAETTYKKLNKAQQRYVDETRKELKDKLVSDTLTDIRDREEELLKIQEDIDGALKKGTSQAAIKELGQDKDTHTKKLNELEETVKLLVPEKAAKEIEKAKDFKDKTTSPLTGDAKVEPRDLSFKKVSEVTVISPKDSVAETQKYVNEIVKNWKNAPDIVVVNGIAELEKKLGVSAKVRSLYSDAKNFQRSIPEEVLEDYQLMRQNYFKIRRGEIEVTETGLGAIDLQENIKRIEKDYKMVKDKAELNRLRDKSMSVKGIYDGKTDQIYINAATVTSKKDVLKTVLHESIGHFGLRSILGADYKATMDKLYKTDPQINMAANNLMREEKLTKEEAVEELIAVAAENAFVNRTTETIEAKGFVNALKKLLQSAVKIIRQKMANLGFPILSNPEVQTLIDQSAGFVLRGKVRKVSGEFVDDTTFREEEVFEDLTAEDAKKARKATKATRIMFRDAVAMSNNMVVDNFLNMNVSNSKGPTPGIFGDMSSAKFDIKRPFLKFAVQVAYKGASIEKKAREAYNNKVRDYLGNIRPDILMLSTEHADTLAVAVMRLGKLNFNKLSGFEAVEGDASLAGVFDKIATLGEKIGDPEKAMQLVNDALIIKRAKDLKNENIIPDELLPTKEQIEAGEKIFKLYGREIDSIHNEFTAFKNGLIDNMVESGRLDPEIAQKWKLAAGYVPWNRIKENEIEVFKQDPRRFFKGLATREIGRIKGSKDTINNVFDNMVGLSFWMVKSSMRNHAGLAIVDSWVKNNLGAKKLPGKPDTDRDNVVTVFRNGKPEYYEFDDILDVYAFKGLETMSGPIISVMTSFSDLLRKGVTATPQFAISQLFQDSYRAMTLSGTDKPFKTATRVINPLSYANVRFGNDKVINELKRYGIVGSFDFTPGRAGEEIREQFGLSQKNKLSKFFDFFEKFSIASDANLRKAVFLQTLEETKSEQFPNGDLLKARYAAQEIINFKRQGANKYVGVLRQIVPFMNAYIQGMSVYIRTMQGQGVSQQEKAVAQRLFLKAGYKLATLSTIYAFLVAEDEEYQQQNEYVKDKNFIIPGTGVKLPVAPEIGLLFKVIPERTINYVISQGTARPEDAQTFRENIQQAAFDALSGPNLTPQFFKPIAEVYLNYSFFRDGPIVPTGLRDVANEKQFTSSTSELAKMFGELTGASPIQMEYLFRGMTGIFGGSLLDFTNVISSRVMGRREYNLYELPGFKTFMYDKIPSGDKTEYYKFRDEVGRVVDTVNLLYNRGDLEGIKKYLDEDDNAQLYALQSSINNVTKQLSETRALKRLINEDKSISPEEKTRRINELDMLDNELVRTLGLTGEDKIDIYNIPYIKKNILGR